MHVSSSRTVSFSSLCGRRPNTKKATRDVIKGKLSKWNKLALFFLKALFCYIYYERCNAFVPYHYGRRWWSKGSNGEWLKSILPFLGTYLSGRPTVHQCHPLHSLHTTKDPECMIYYLFLFYYYNFNLSHQKSEILWSPRGNSCVTVAHSAHQGKRNLNDKRKLVYKEVYKIKIQRKYKRKICTIFT